MLAATPALAQPPVPGRDTSATAPASPPVADTTAGGIRIVGEGARTIAPDTSHRKLPRHEQPRFVMARSLIIPGWGQLHNGSWLKAGLVAAAETWLGVNVVRDQRRLDDLLGQIDPLQAVPPDSLNSDERRLLNALVNEYNGVLDQRLGRQWMLGGVLAYALVDAYVDAHFRNFDLEFQHDPALPPGSSPAHPADRGGRFGFRVALRRHF